MKVERKSRSKKARAPKSRPKKADKDDTVLLHDSGRREPHVRKRIDVAAIPKNTLPGILRKYEMTDLQDIARSMGLQFIGMTRDQLVNRLVSYMYGIDDPK